MRRREEKMMTRARFLFLFFKIDKTILQDFYVSVSIYIDLKNADLDLSRSIALLNKKLPYLHRSEAICTIKK